MKTVDKHKRVVFYIRKSTDEEDRQILSLDDQLSECQKLVLDEYELVKAFTESCSAKKPGKRKEFRQMLDFITKENIDGIISWDAKRLSRNPTESGELQQLLIDKKIFIKTHFSTYFDSNWILFLVDTGFAAEDIRNLSENVKRGLNSKVKMGLRPGLAPLGFINNKWMDKGEKDVRQDEERLALLKKWFGMVLSGDTVENSLETISRMGLTEPATRKRPERNVSRTLAYKIFKNPFYAGYFWWKGELIKGKHKAIITWREYEIIQNRLSCGVRSKAGGQERDYLGALVSLIKCSKCGSTIVYDSRSKTYKNGTSQRFAYYRCPHRHGPCPEKAVRAEDMYSQTKTYLESLSLHPAFTDWCRKVLKRRNGEEFQVIKKQREFQNKQLQNIDRKIEILITKKIDKWVSPEEYEKQRTELLLDQKRIRESSLLDRLKTWEDTIDKVLSFGEQMKNIFDNGDPLTKRQAIRILGSDLKLKDGKLWIDPRFTFVFLRENQDYLVSKSVGLKNRLMNGTLTSIYDNEVPFGAGEGSRTPFFSLES